MNEKYITLSATALHMCINNESNRDSCHWMQNCGCKTSEIKNLSQRKLPYQHSVRGDTLTLARTLKCPRRVSSLQLLQKKVRT